MRHVVATAGHVDHGKSTLVRALTGMEPDRLAEERRRGLTIDLGFAWTDLPSGAHVAFVDVPGHERFIATMLAGIGPAPAVLFVVAADEGWARQSDEHLAAVDALDLRHGLLAVTRSDRADPAAARDVALERLASSSLGVVPAVTVSGRTGAGLDDLRVALDALLAGLPAPDTAASIRLWVDRSFSITGAGTVVTGTLSAGTLRVGDQLDLDGRTVSIRGLQSAGTTYDELSGATRVAVNLRGVGADDVRRGDVLVTPGAWLRTDTLDVRLAASGDLPGTLILHVGTAAVPARLRPLDERHARVHLDRALPLRAGDRAVLRDPGRQVVAAGVLVLDADPPVLRRRGAARLRAETLAAATGRPDPHTELARRGAATRAELERLGVDTSDLNGHGGWLVDPGAWQRGLDAAPGTVAAWAQAHPLDPAMPEAALARELGLPPPLLPELIAATGLPSSSGRVGDPRPTVGAGVRELVARLRARPFRAPDADELAALALDHRQLAAAERAGLILRLDGVVLLPDALDLAVRELAALPQPFTLSAARQALGTTRRVAVPLLEHLDAVGRTIRVDAVHRSVHHSGGYGDLE